MIIITIMTHDIYYRSLLDKFTSADNIHRSIESLVTGYNIDILVLYYKLLNCRDAHDTCVIFCC